VTPPLFLLDALATFGAGDVVALGGDEGRHAAKVKRMTVGETVLVSDGCGSLATCEVASIRPDGLELRIVELAASPEPDPRLVVVQALPKGDRAELAVEIMTELGVDVIVPWSASRSIAQWSGPRGDKSLVKWRRTAREATKQSRRPRVPEITDLASTAQVATRLAGACALVLHEDAADPLVSTPLAASGDVVVVVGPEGGVSADELAAFAGAGARTVRLGAPVLRTSTAGAAALSVLSHRVGRWG
jgi:16S rRNA (uracil1498-N3)-methyltransferase